MNAADTLKHLLAIAAETRRRLVQPAGGNWFDYLDRTNEIMEIAEGEIAAVLANAQAIGYSEEAAKLIRAATGEAVPLPKIDVVSHRPIELVHPVEGARFLRGMAPFLPEEFDLLSQASKRIAFTIARQTSEDAVEAVRDVVADAVGTGKTFRQVRGDLREAIGNTPLADHHLETIYRTYVGKAQAAGKLATLDHPIVRDEFPYLLYSSTNDSRVRLEHRAFEFKVKEYPGSPWGLNGTNIYRSDDPIWDTFWPPWAWNCRCDVIPIPKEYAASMGVREAIKWVDSGRPPAIPEYIKPPPYTIPVGWVPTGRRLQAA